VNKVILFQKSPIIQQQKQHSQDYLFIIQHDTYKNSMGCGGSKADGRLQTVDDSVHVMLAHDRKVQKMKGEKPHGYVPRAEHPLLKPKPAGATENGNVGDPAAAGTTTKPGGGESSTGESTKATSSE
jgi:hypothetical protein